MNYPKWKYKNHQSTLVANSKIEDELVRDGWSDDPHPDDVPLPAELDTEGTMMHHGTNADANGRFAYGPAPTRAGMARYRMG